MVLLNPVMIRLQTTLSRETYRGMKNKRLKRIEVSGTISFFSFSFFDLIMRSFGLFICIFKEIRTINLRQTSVFSWCMMTYCVLAILVSIIIKYNEMRLERGG